MPGEELTPEPKRDPAADARPRVNRQRVMDPGAGRTLAELGRRLRSLDGKGYKAYKSVKGAYDGELDGLAGEPGTGAAAAGGEPQAGRFRLLIDHVQGDPFAEPSRLRALLAPATAGLPEWATRSLVRRTAAADFLHRAFHAALAGVSSHRGSGRSGELRILRCGQEILQRSSLAVTATGAVEARFRAGLPARGRRVLGAAAAELLCERVPRAVAEGLLFGAADPEALRRHVDTAEDAGALRAQLADLGLVAFVADGALLPRRSGVDDRPLPRDEAVPFQAPGSLRVSLDAPNAGQVSGMGIPAGVTLIVGGGYHGKSTLLRAIERGVYDHIPDDGRERVVTVAGAVKVRAEDGRRIAGTDISNFIGRLPGGGDTRHFHTDNASGSTSQAAAIAEALEVGATCLLLDEDTSATNFMIRDARMQALIPDEFEPITPFVDRVGQLGRDPGISTVLVMGGSGDYFEVADTVIAMRDYLPADETRAARRIAETRPTKRRRESGPWRPLRTRVPLPGSLDPSRGRRSVSVKTRSRDRVLFGSEEVGLGAVEQVVELAQVRAMAEALVWARGRAIDGRRDLRAALEEVMNALAEDGLDAFMPYPVGELAAFRIFELAAFLGRIRSLEVR